MELSTVHALELTLQWHSGGGYPRVIKEVPTVAPGHPMQRQEGRLPPCPPAGRMGGSLGIRDCV